MMPNSPVEYAAVIYAFLRHLVRAVTSCLKGQMVQPGMENKDPLARN
jgi:hypothetical protein